VQTWSRKLKIIFITCASTMAASSAAGHGTNDGTRKTQSGTRMDDKLHR
jgi:hypothetical protein